VLVVVKCRDTHGISRANQQVFCVVHTRECITLCPTSPMARATVEGMRQLLEQWQGIRDLEMDLVPVQNASMKDKPIL
jgi:hypothetical protein